MRQKQGSKELKKVVELLGNLIDSGKIKGFGGVVFG